MIPYRNEVNRRDDKLLMIELKQIKLLQSFTLNLIQNLTKIEYKSIKLYVHVVQKKINRSMYLSMYEVQRENNFIPI